MCITRKASNEIFSPSNKMHWEVGWTKDLSASRYKICIQKQKYIFTMSYIYSFWHLGIYAFISLWSVWFIALDRLSVIHCWNMMVFNDVWSQRSRDSGREDDASVKQQLSSLLYVHKVIETRLQRLKEGADSDSVGGLPSTSLQNIYRFTL